MLETEGQFCACGRELTDEKERNYGACYTCMYQKNGDFDNFPNRFEPTHGGEDNDGK